MDMAAADVPVAAISLYMSIGNCESLILCELSIQLKQFICQANVLSKGADFSCYGAETEGITEAVAERDSCIQRLCGMVSRTEVPLDNTSLAI